jgi:predicted Zn-dependent protease
VSVPAQAQFGGLGSLIGHAGTAKKMGESMRSIGEPEEIQIGGQLAGIVLGAAPLVEDQALQHYVNRLGRWLALHSERPNLPWKFGVIETDDFNAFSTPGGYVLISRGLYDRMRSESELAGVLAHEIAHVTAKHHLKALQKGKGMSALSEIGGSVASSQVGGGLAGEAVKKLIDSGKEMFIKGLDKDDEYEADRMGVIIAARSGYSPYGLVGVLQTLSAAQTETGFSLMTKTHPTAVSRIDRLDRTMGTRFDAMGGFVDDLPSFEHLRNPAPPVVEAAATIEPKPASAPKPGRKARK